MLTEVTDEGILGIVAKKVSLLPREPVKDQHLSLSLTRSFSIGAWQARDGMKSVSPVKSIHHFCVLHDGLQLPTPYRGVWQQHHRQMSSPVSDLA